MALNIPIDMKDPNAKTLIIKACEEFGFFRLANHGVPMELMKNLQNLSTNFFDLSQVEKDAAHGYGNKAIGHKGDMGWVEYLLLNTNPQTSPNPFCMLEENSAESFRSTLEEYIIEVKRVACQVLEAVILGLKINESKDFLSKLVMMDESSDSIFRINHYQQCPELQSSNLIAFGEHTDPQILSFLNSNNTSGLQICLKNDTWVAVPLDESLFSIFVGDTLQVMITNGRFKSMKHRVLGDPHKSRISMIFFGGPPLNEWIKPISCLLMAENEESLYMDFMWKDYKSVTYESKLVDNRFGHFEKNVTICHCAIEGILVIWKLKN